MPQVNATHVCDLDLATGHVEKLIYLAKIRGALAGVDRKRVAQMSRTAKWLRKAIGNMVFTDPQLLQLLPKLAIKPELTDAELDALPSR